MPSRYAATPLRSSPFLWTITSIYHQRRLAVTYATTRLARTVTGLCSGAQYAKIASTVVQPVRRKIGRSTSIAAPFCPPKG